MIVVVNFGDFCEFCGFDLIVNCGVGVFIKGMKLIFEGKLIVLNFNIVK